MVEVYLEEVHRQKRGAPARLSEQRVQHAVVQKAGDLLVRSDQGRERYRDRRRYLLAFDRQEKLSENTEKVRAVQEPEAHGQGGLRELPHDEQRRVQRVQRSPRSLLVKLEQLVQALHEQLRALLLKQPRQDELVLSRVPGEQVHCRWDVNSNFIVAEAAGLEVNVLRKILKDQLPVIYCRKDLKLLQNGREARGELGHARHRVLNCGVCDSLHVLLQLQLSTQFNKTHFEMELLQNKENTS